MLFGLIRLDPVQTPDMILLGSYLGWVAYRTGSTRSSMLCHLVNNAAAIGLGMIGSKSGNHAEAATTLQLLVMFMIGLRRHLHRDCQPPPTRY